MSPMSSSFWGSISSSLKGKLHRSLQVAASHLEVLHGLSVVLRAFCAASAFFLEN